MGAFPQLSEAQRAVDIGMLTGTSTASLMTQGAANVKGAWLQLTASTSFDIAAVIVCLGTVNIASWLVDIGIGAAASEVVVVPNLAYQTVTSAGPTMTWFYLPLSIPAGTRIAGRCQSPSAAAVAIGLIGLAS